MGCGSSAPVDNVEAPTPKPKQKTPEAPAKAEVAVSANGAPALPTLLPQPENPTGKIVMIECEGGSDKKADGHRGDTIPISNALIEKGWECVPVFYSDAKYDEVKAMVMAADGFITRINPGTYPGVTQSKVDEMLREAAAAGVAPMQHPDVMQKMGAKDALVKIANLSCGMSDTYAYYDIESFKENFPKSVATGVRVLKQNRGSQGEGIWVCKVKEGQEGEVNGSTVLDLQEAVDNHKEEKTVDEFMTFCEQYIVGENGQLIDQRFLPRIVEGELRVNMIYDKPTEIVHKKPAEGGISATLKSGAKYVSYQPDDPQFKKLMDDFVNKDLPQIMPCLGMEGMPIPLIWTSDFILGDKVDGEDTYFVGEFNCSCVGITQQLHLKDQVADAVIKIVEMTKGIENPAPPLPVLLKQPENPTGKIVMIECEGGSDKKADGHRGDTIPISNALIKKGWSCVPVFYSDAKYDEVKAMVMAADGFITRINPGTYPGVTQSKVDEMLREAAAAGVAPMQHPDVMQKMGAKDALVKIANLSCGMSDTYAYYDIESFKENFPKSVATGVRVLKQNRGSQGEGIWVCKVKEGQEGEVNGSTVLDLQEAVDNHKEEKTVDEFMTFCEQYIVGENGQLIDQRFLPRIVEGELRVNMIYDKPTEIVHKKPAEGGISATLKSGAKYVSYQPDDPQFKKLMDDFVNKDLPQIMPCLGMEGMPIPLIWTSDFILGDKVDGEDTYFVGEFNCSCVGITQQLHLKDQVADAVIKIVEMTKANPPAAPAAAEAPALPTLLPQPENPTGKIVMIECEGGSDKKADGHRGDTIPISNALIEKGWECVPVFYSDAKYDEVKAMVMAADGFITRINPGTYPGVTQSKVDEMLREAAAAGVAPMQHPDVMQKMGAKDALVKIANLSCGMSDTYAYYDIESFKENFPKSVATGVRVLKQNRGSQGEGIWVCKVKEGQEGEVNGSTVLDLQEAVDNHKEEKTVDEFMTFCEQYIVGENGQLIDQRFLPRIVEGELRVNMIYDKPTEIVHKKPAEGGISATLKSGAKYVSYQPDDPQFKKLMDDFVNKDLPQIMPCLGMEGMPIPLIWTSDFILGDKVDGEDTYFVGEFNCSCVGITQQLHLKDQVADAVIKIVEMTKANPPAAPAAAEAPALPTLLPQPENPTGKIVMIECEGGSDKKADGHRGDTIPISNALIEKGWECVPVFYSDAKYDEVKAMVMAADGFITRINPGTYPGVTQSKVDEMLREAAAAGVAPMQHPDVMQKMGAKDALVKIANLSCGMSDTYAYYDIESFKENFPKSVATGVRVLKQNRGSQGEGIWVCKVKEGQEGEVNGSTVLDLQEAVDNHKEEKTVDEFMTFCEQYIVGENGQLIDQRFLPRIVEGELRVNMIYDKPTEIVHKKPAEGGISATLKSGAKYVSYQPDDPQFKKLMDDFVNKDLPQIMPCLGMEGMPIPLIWTSDFILGDKVDGEDTYFVGEFNCSCVGITQQLHLKDQVADAVIKIVEMTKANSS